MKKRILLLVFLIFLSSTLYAQLISESAISNLSGFNNIQRVMYKSDIVYLLDSYYLISVDISRPSNPAILDSLQMGDWTLAMDIQGNIAFVTAGTYLYAIDISQPDNLTLIV